MIFKPKIMDVSGRKNRKLIKNNYRSFSNASIIKKIFCLHIYEYQQMEEIGADWECRKCGTQRD